MTLTLFTTAYAQTIDKAKLDQFFDQLAEKNKAMGDLLIAKDDNVLYSRSIGYSQINGTEKKPLTGETWFGIASITKMFTATMIFQLVEEGRLKLTDTLGKFFPEVPNAEKITIAQMLSHRSGMPNVQRKQNAERNVQTTPITEDETLALIVKATPDFEPGTKHSYSNSGYVLLALIVKSLTGKQYGEALKERITLKLRLADTYSAIRNIDVSKNEAVIYYIIGGEWKQHSETFRGVRGSFISTPKDLAKFTAALFDGKIVTRESLDQMKTMRDGEGMGMTTFTFADKTFYSETGEATAMVRGWHTCR
jgi:CubicO group peptidase (beta-lactamase class C family)